MLQMTPDMESMLPAKDSLFAIPGRSSAASMRQTVFSRQHRSHILLLYSIQSERDSNGTQ